MNRAKTDLAWRLLATALVDVLNPALLLSMALFVSIGYIFTLLMPMTINEWSAVFALAVALPLFGLLVHARHKWSRATISAQPPAWRALLPLVLPVMVVAPGVYAIVASPTVQILYHGDIHFGYINQLLYGSTPPDNVFVAGYPANYYWLFHAWIATIVKITGLKSPHVASLLNVLALLSALLWIGQTLVLLKLNKLRTFALGLSVVFVFCAVNATGALSLAINLVSGKDFALGDSQLLLLEGAHYLLSGALGKITNINSMDTGIAAFAAALFCCIKICRDNLDIKSLAILSAGGIVGLSCLQLAPLYIVVALLGGLAAACSFILTRRFDNKRACIAAVWRDSNQNMPRIVFLLWFGISLALSVPLLKYNIDIAYNTLGHTRFELFYASNMAWLWGAFALLLPFVCLHFVFILQKSQLTESFIVFASLIGLLLASGVIITINNQYKGFYFLALLLALSTLLALKDLEASNLAFWRYCSPVLRAMLFVLVAARILYMGLSLLDTPQVIKYRGFGYDRNHIIHSHDEYERFPAYYWIRDNTPYDAIVLVPIKSFKFANILSERLFYVRKKQFTYLDNIPEYEERVNRINAFFYNDTSMEYYRKTLADIERILPRDLYAVVKDTEVSQEVMLARGAELVYDHSGAGANVYLLNPEPSP